MVVYNQQFESQRLSELAAWLPEFEGRVKKIQPRLWDCFRSSATACTISAPLKAVLPALVPSINYVGIVVGDGQDAGLAWESLVRGNLDQVEREKTRKALLDYCGQDTLALVRLVDRLLLAVG